ncbi:MAG: MBL fold metallo-hydrolase [Gammaproteobacteria bacterium]
MRVVFTLVMLVLAHGATDAVAQSASGPQWVTLGTQGGPNVRHSTAQISNALVVGDSIYLFDLGSGVLRQMEGAGLGIENVRAAFITHHHRDHNTDTGAVLFEHGARKAEGAPRLKLIGPTGTKAFSDALLMAQSARVAATDESPRTPISSLVESIDLSDEMDEPTIIFEDEFISVSAITVDHFFRNSERNSGYEPRAVAYRAEVDGSVFVYSGDTGAMTPALETLSQGADVLICEVMLLSIPEGFLRSHVGPEHIATIADAADVGSVVLTHYLPRPPWNSSVIENALDLMRPIYQGPVTAARDLDRFDAQGNRLGMAGSASQ